MSGEDETTDQYTGALLKDINDKLQAILEGQKSLARVPTELQVIQDRLERVESDTNVIRFVATDLSAKLNDHKLIISKLGVLSHEPSNCNR